MKLKKPAPAFDSYQVGSQIRLDDQLLHCTETNTGTCSEDHE